MAIGLYGVTIGITTTLEDQVLLTPTIATALIIGGAVPLLGNINFILLGRWFEALERDREKP